MENPALRICGIWITFLCSLALVTRAQAALDPYDRTKDIRPSTLKEIEDGRQNWGLDTTIGAGLARGNANVDSINIELDSFKSMGDYAGYLLGDLYYMDFNGVRVRNQGNVIARTDYKTGENWRIFAVTSHAYNQYIQLGYRGTLGAGLLYKLDIGPVKSGISIAPTYELETYLNDEVRRTLRLSFRYLVHVQISDTASLGVDYFYLPSVLDISNYRMYLSVSLENQVYKKLLGLRLSYNTEYYSSPISGVLNLDTNFSTSFVLHLGD